MPSGDEGQPPAAGSARRFAFSLLCQKGELEIGALLLAASLRRFLRCPHELVAGIPSPADRTAPSAKTLDLLGRMGVRTSAIAKPLGPRSTQARKIECLDIPTSVDKVVLLDSDMLCVSTFRDEPRFSIAFNARPADPDVFLQSDEVRRAACTAAGVGTGLALPSFATSFVAVANGAPLGETWAECAAKVTPALPVAYVRPPRPRTATARVRQLTRRVRRARARRRRNLEQRALWSEQISLAIAAHKLGLEVDCLDERYDHPTYRKPLDAEEAPFLSRYRSPDVIRREPRLLALVRELVETYPGISELMASQDGWRSVLQPRRVPAARPTPVTRGAPVPPDLIVTGISRSGTSYLCNLLHRFDNCVAINEPGRVLSVLRGRKDPSGIPVLYAELRRDILDGRPIANKLVNGDVVEDTAIYQRQHKYTPSVAADDFVLAVKNTREFLCRLDAVRRVMPAARVVACVRDPFDTIASWKGSFPHLRNADVVSFMGRLDDPWVPEKHRVVLEGIAAMPDLAERRAMLWCFFAERVLEHRDNLLLVDYDDLVREPMTVLNRMLRGYRPGRPRRPITPSVARPKRELLDEHDRRAIRAICSQAAADLQLAMCDPC